MHIVSSSLVGVAALEGHWFDIGGLISALSASESHASAAGVRRH